MKVKLSNFIAFDIGSSKISALMAYINKQGDIKISSQILHNSEGFKAGNIINMELAENSIMNAIYALEKDSEKNIREIAISLSGAGVKSYYVSHTIKIGSSPISRQDVKKLINKTLSKFNIKDQEIVHYFPMEFCLDNRQVVDNPLGMYAREISCQLHIITANSIMLMNLTKCLAKCNIEVNEVIASVYASGISTLNQDEQELGCIIVDIGSHTTSYGIFLDKKIIYSNHVPIGGLQITTDIAKKLSINIQLAEKLKILYGNASPDIVFKDNAISLEGVSLSVTTSQLARIIKPRIKEILLKIRRDLDSLKMENLLTRTMVITGGSAAMPGIKNVAADIFQKRVRIAAPENMPGFTESYNPYVHSTAIGMVKAQSIKQQDKSSLIKGKGDKGFFKRFIGWLKENI